MLVNIYNVMIQTQADNVCFVINKFVDLITINDYCEMYSRKRKFIFLAQKATNLH